VVDGPKGAYLRTEADHEDEINFDRLPRCKA
jgi:hypothetical protein